jgi:SAM-dependent methyltransferase
MTIEPDISAELQVHMAGWRLDADRNLEQQIEALIEPLLAAGLLPHNHESVDAILLGEQYHLGGTEDTRGMAELVGLTAADRVVDLACYIGGPARQLARDYGCQVVGVDISPVHVAVAQRLTHLCRLDDRVSFVCARADAVPFPDGSFTVAWSQCTFPSDLSWMMEITRLLAPAGRVAFTGIIRRAASTKPELLHLDEVAERVTHMGYRVISAEDISDAELALGWLPARRRLAEHEARYRELMGDAWVEKAYQSLDADIGQWQSGEMGDGRVAAVKL